MELVSELESEAGRIDSAFDQWNSRVGLAAKALRDASVEVGRSSANSWAHAGFYYGDFSPPPSGAAFDPFGGARYSPRGWREYTYEEVLAEIFRQAGCSEDHADAIHEASRS